MILIPYLTATIMFLSPVLTTSIYQDQTLIAWFQLAPLFTVIVQITLAFLISIFLPPQSDNQHPASSSSAVGTEKQQSRTLTKTSLLLSIFFSASIHIYCLLTTLLSSPSSSPSTTYFSSIYIPSLTSVHPNSAEHNRPRRLSVNAIR